jgi:hypothetical protein
VLAIFGWSTRGPSRRLSQARSDIAYGSPTLLHVIYLLCRNHYDCTSEIRPYPGYWSDTDFMTFSPTSPYILPGQPGPFISNTLNLNEFASHIVDLNCMESSYLTQEMIQLLYLAIIFDFMALTAQAFHRTLRVSSRYAK